MLSTPDITTGLHAEEAARRLKVFGPNEIVGNKKMSPIRIFLEKLKSPILVLMTIVAIVSYVMGQHTSAILMLVMVFISSILDFFNTFQSQKAVEKLISQVVTTVTVIRDGRQQEVNIRQIVVGDIILLSAGNIVPADCQVLTSDDLFVNQAALTGESLPVEKICTDKLSEVKNLAKDTDKIFMGTSVTSGLGTVIVLKTGLDTEFGKIAKALNQGEIKTDFEKNIMSFSFFVMRVIFYMVSFVFIVFLLKNIDHLTKDVFLQTTAFALAITIGVSPDMLPAIMTVCLSKGSQSMAKKKVIVKHLSAIENFGSMDILCTDKTGTLTQDHITLVKYVDFNGKDNHRILELGYLASYYHSGITNQLDQAIVDYENLTIADFKKVDEIPYDFHRRRSSMVVDDGKTRVLITKGAPEEVIKICQYFEGEGTISSDPNIIEKVLNQYQRLSQDGFRVLAVARREIPSDASIKGYSKDTEAQMTFMGFLAFLDPPKEDVQQTISDLTTLGIEVKILTGDSELLTQKICRDIHMPIKGTLIGTQIEELDDAELAHAVLETTIFARVSPEQKDRIVLTLKRIGKTVGYLGDGINDAPALKTADVGISVNNATDIARETADIILLKKSLEALKDGIIEGRKTFQNTTKYILMGLSSNFGNMFSMMGASTFLPFLPMLPAQVLFNNFLYDIGQLSLPTDNVDKEDLLKPTHWNMNFIRNYMIVFGLMSSIFDFLTFWLLYYVNHLEEGQFQNGWLIESIATQTFVIYIIRTKKIPFLQSSPSRALFITTFLAVSIAWVTQFTPLGTSLGLVRLPVNIMMIILGYVIVYLLLVEGVKHVFYAVQRKKQVDKGS